MDKILYVGSRVRIRFVRNQVFQHLAGTEGTIVGRALPAAPFKPEDQGDWLVSCDIYGGTQSPFFTYVWDAETFQTYKVYPHFCPTGDQLEAINPGGFDPSNEDAPAPDALIEELIEI